MKYYSMLKQLFNGIELIAEDLLHLESFQIKYLSDHVPQKEFTNLLREYPFIERFLISKYPPISSFINGVFKENEKINDKDFIDEHCDSFGKLLTLSFIISSPRYTMRRLILHGMFQK